MKILYINNFKSLDYLNDVIFHGGRKLFGSDLVDSTYAYYMYDNIDYNTKCNLYGRGFTVTGNLPIIEVDRDNIVEKISDHFYDLIIYGSIHRDNSYIKTVLNYYKKNEIVFLDGEDGFELQLSLIGKGVYFKREMIEYNHKFPTLPISFAFPIELMRDTDIVKEQIIAKFTSAQNGYYFDTQEEYYNEYRKSYFGLTKKKAGWDCMRHYEILLSGAIPVMKDLHEIPKLTMVHWDRELLKIAVELFWNFRMDGLQDREYNDIRSAFINHAKNDLNTESMFRYILNQL
jgi:hypothetical protein